MVRRREMILTSNSKAHDESAHWVPLGIAASRLSSLAFGRETFAEAVAYFPEGQSDFEEAWRAEQNPVLLVRLLERTNSLSAIKIAALCVQAAIEQTAIKRVEIGAVLQAICAWQEGFGSADECERVACSAEDAAAAIMAANEDGGRAECSLDLASADLCLAAYHLGMAPNAQFGSSAAVNSVVNCLVTARRSHDTTMKASAARAQVSSEFADLVRANASVPVLADLFVRR